MASFRMLSTAVLLAGVASVAAAVNNVKTSYTFLFQDNLDLSTNYAHVGAILLDPLNYFQAEAACSALNEKLISEETLMKYKSDFTAQLSYVEYAGYVPSVTQSFWIDGGVVQVTEGASSFRFPKPSNYGTLASLPVLCTQTQGTANVGGAATTTNELTVRGGNGNSFVGFRNQKVFLFQGIRYAQFPGRFNYSSVYSPSNEVADATAYGSQCYSFGSGAEDCFFLNVWTPYIPKAGTKKNLRPVLFWIHGGGYVGGSGSGSDGSDLAAREDVVVVGINYRLGNFGFFAAPGVLSGNYGTGDQVTALEWVIANIARFGGDPKRITIAGASAGAASVSTLLGSPRAIGKFQGAIAMSHLGGGKTLGQSRNYGTMYSSIYTIAEAFANEGLAQTLLQVGCNQSTLEAQVACLKTVPAQQLSSTGTQAQAVVIDGSIVNTQHLEVESISPNKNVAHVPVIFGVARNDGAAIGTGYSKTCTTLTECLQANLYISSAYAKQIIDSGLFPVYDTRNLAADSFNVSQRIATDTTFRCNDQAMMYAGARTGSFSAVYYYESIRGFPGSSYNPNGVGITGNISDAYPNGDPSTFYYVSHSSDVPLLFGQVYPLRAPSDLNAIQLTTAYFGAFIKTGNPNPSQAELRIKGYTTALSAVKRTGPWNQVSSATGPLKLLDYPARTAQFQDLKQCSFLNISSTYWLDGGLRTLA